MLRFVILVVLLAFPSGAVRAIEAESEIDIWVQNSCSNLSSVLKIYCIKQSVLAQRGKQTAQPENTS